VDFTVFATGRSIEAAGPEFVGMVVAALGCDPHLMERSGQVVIAVQLARELNVFDTDGRHPTPLVRDTV
jgi:hypothetical protein